MIAGVLLLPGPVYATVVEGVTEPDRTRGSVGYTATEIDLSNDTRVADRYGPRVAVRLSAFDFPHVAREYAAPNATQRLVARAIRAGNATTTSDAVERDLRRLTEDDSLVTREFEEYYLLTVETTDGTTTVETRAVNDSAVARRVRAAATVSYGSLSPPEQATFRKIRRATANESQLDYRPWTDEPLPPKPIVVRNGTAYAVEQVSVSDDFDFLPVIVGSGLSVIGGLLVFASGLLVVVRRVGTTRRVGGRGR